MSENYEFKLENFPLLDQINELRVHRKEILRRQGDARKEVNLPYWQPIIRRAG